MRRLFSPSSSLSLPLLSLRGARSSSTATPPPPPPPSSPATPSSSTTTATTTTDEKKNVPATKQLAARTLGSPVYSKLTKAEEDQKKIDELEYEDNSGYVPEDVKAFHSLVDKYSKEYEPPLKAKSFLSDTQSRHKRYLRVEKKRPIVSVKAFVAPDAVVSGLVGLAHGSSIWYGCTLRADKDKIYIGASSNIQDNTSIYPDDGYAGPDHSTRIGDHVTVGHSCVLKSCRIDSESLIGMGSVILGGAHVHSNSIVAAGSVVERNQVIPSGQLWAGAPAKYIRDLTHEEEAEFQKMARNYTEIRDEHADEYYLHYDELEHKERVSNRFETFKN